MTKNAKKVSSEDGSKFLQEAFKHQQEVLSKQLVLSATSITHKGKRGDVDEKHFIDILRRYLPDRYSVDSAIVIDSNGHTSDQIDVVIFDRQYTPTLLDQQNHIYVPAEAVYAVLEVKPTIDKEYLEYAGKKAASVRRLRRTSVAIPHAGGKHKAKPHFNIVAGIVAADIGWKNGLGKSFREVHAKLKRNSRLDCGLAVSGHSFDTFHQDHSYTLGPKENALVFFLFRLLQKLQSLATVPAIDWDAYASQLGVVKK